MTTNQDEIIQNIRAGTLNANEIRTALGASNATTVYVDDWAATYNAGTGQLSVYCTAVSGDAGDQITGIGLIAYSANGATMYALQYTNGLNDAQIMTSIGTSLFNPSYGDQVLSVLYGWTNQSSFYLTRTLDIQNG